MRGWSGRRSVFVSLFFLVVILAGGAGVSGALPATDGGGQAETADPTAATADGELAVSVARHDDSLRYTLSLSPGPAVERLWVVVGGAEVVSASGFERASGERGTRLRWTGDGSGDIVLDVRAEREETPVDGSVRREKVATEDWTFARVPFVEVQRVRNRTLSRSWPLTEQERRLADEEGVFADRYAFVGPTDVVTRSAGERTVRVVTPSGATPTAGADAIADALATATRRFEVGDRDETVLAFAVPGVRRGGESIPARDEFWVNADARLDTADNVWFHEYVHTRQSFELAEDMRWFREASAEYYGARLSYEQGHIDEREMAAHLDGTPSNATLTAPETWETRHTPHRKGARVLAVLDRKIRAETHGHRSLEDVFRRLNGHGGRVTYAVFAQTVGEVAGTPMDGWLDRYVDGDAAVATSASAEVTPDSAGGPTADHGSSPVVFVGLSFGLSVVAAAPLYRVLDVLD